MLNRLRVFSAREVGRVCSKWLLFSPLVMWRMPANGGLGAAKSSMRLRVRFAAMLQTQAARRSPRRYVGEPKQRAAVYCVYLAYQVFFLFQLSKKREQTCEE